MMTSEETDSLGTAPSDGHPEDMSGVFKISLLIISLK